MKPSRAYVLCVLFPEFHLNLLSSGNDLPRSQNLIFEALATSSRRNSIGQVQGSKFRAPRKGRIEGNAETRAVPFQKILEKRSADRISEPIFDARSSVYRTSISANCLGELSFTEDPNVQNGRRAARARSLRSRLQFPASFIHSPIVFGGVFKRRPSKRNPPTIQGTAPSVFERGWRRLAEAVEEEHKVGVYQTHTCWSLMYQVRLAAGLLRPDVQFKRSISSIRYFLLSPCIDGLWEGNSVKQETPGIQGAGSMRGMFETRCFDFKPPPEPLSLPRHRYAQSGVYVLRKGRKTFQDRSPDTRTDSSASVPRAA